LTTMMEIDVIGDVDRAKCILKCWTKVAFSGKETHQKKRGKKTKKKAASSSTTGADTTAINRLLGLTYANKESCQEAATALRQAFPTVFGSVNSYVRVYI
jgi:hypothetical protein